MDLRQDKPPDMRARVVRGAALLDEMKPGWYNKINVGALVMSDCAMCIVGQVMEVGQRNPMHEWDDAIYALTGISNAGFPGEAEAHQWGFEVDGDESYTALRELWVQQIALRVS